MNAPGETTRMFQIREDDLAELERQIPDLIDRCMFDRLDAKGRTQIRVIKRIMSDVRWNYGPPENVEIIPAAPEGDDE